ncbi:MAG TPA: hypothetical protein VNJ04_07460, partial [Gemmatimonadaceae bacterium]|nr:hypothetical protein [Gemmatimonadaceae bacterium]
TRSGPFSRKARMGATTGDGPLGEPPQLATVSTTPARPQHKVRATVLPARRRSITRISGVVAAVDPAALERGSSRLAG